MPTDRSDVHAALVESARILARGGRLEAKLDALAAQVSRVTGSVVTVVYLLDAGSRTLVPAGAFGMSEQELSASAVALDEPNDPVARAAVERTATIRSSDASRATTNALALRGVHLLACHPLVAEELVGDPEVQGVLVTGFEGVAANADENGELLGAMADLAAVVIRDARLEQALVERSDWLDRMANTDPLTGLANRRAFERILDAEIQRGARQASPLSVVLFEVDDLAGIREREGADAADDVLRVVAATLAELVRVVDTVARVDAGEFAVIAPGSDGATVVRRIRDAIGAIQPPAGRPVTISVGLARFPEQGASVDQLLQAAGAARAQGGAGVA